MVTATPIRSPGIYAGYALMGVLLALIVCLILLLGAGSWDLLAFFWGLLLLMALAAFFLVSFWTSALGVARYTVDEETLLLSWGRRWHRIPLARITGIDDGAGYRLAGWRGLRWPGHMIGVGRLVQPDGPSLPLTVYATRPLAQQLLVFTPEAVYGLSPADPAFAGQLRALVSAAHAAGVPATPVEASLGPLDTALWADRRAQWLLSAGLALNLLLFALLAALQGDLPAGVPLRSAAAGRMAQTGSAAALFLIPLTAMLFWLADALLGSAFYRDAGRRPVAFLVWGSGALLQAGAWAALLIRLA